MAMPPLLEEPGSVPKSSIPPEVHSTACKQERQHEEVPTICPKSLTPFAVALVLLPLSNVPRSLMRVDFDQVKACQFPRVVFDMPTTWPRLLTPKASL